MLELPFYQVNAFIDRPFGGNPAGVCILTEGLPDSVMQEIAAEAGFSETAFLIKRDNDYELRWFTPKAEVNICGHATLASASVVLEILEPTRDAVIFQTRSGALSVTRGAQGKYYMDFPQMPLQWTQPTLPWTHALGARPTRIGIGDYGVAVFDEAQAIRRLTPQHELLMTMEQAVIIATAPSEDTDCDFVLRVFGPRLGIAEDPVTGSAMCALLPYWADRLGRDTLTARQLSRRGGEMGGTRLGNGRVSIAGTVWLYSRGWLRL